MVAGGGSTAPFRSAVERPIPSGLGEQWTLPRPVKPTLSELFASHPRDGGWAGFLLAQLETG
jgi:protein ImuA